MVRNEPYNPDAPNVILVPVYDAHPEIEEYMGHRVLDEIRKLDGDDFTVVNADVHYFETTSGKAVIPENVRGKRLFVVHPYHMPHDTHIMTTVRMANAAKLSKAKEIVLVEPYNKVWRQDKRKGRESLDSRIVAEMYTRFGVDDVITFDPHVDQIQMAFMDTPVEVLHLTGYLTDFIRTVCPEILANLRVTSPDQGAVGRANRAANLLNAEMSAYMKRRFGRARKTEARLLVDYEKAKNGSFEIEGTNVLVFDDVVVSGGSIKKTADDMRAKGAKRVLICAPHMDLTEDAYKILENEEVVTTNTVPGKYETLPNFRTMPVEPIIAQIVTDYARGGSISRHFRDALDE